MSCLGCESVTCGGLCFVSFFSSPIGECGMRRRHHHAADEVERRRAFPSSPASSSCFSSEICESILCSNSLLLLLPVHALYLFGIPAPLYCTFLSIKAQYSKFTLARLRAFTMLPWHCHGTANYSHVNVTVAAIKCNKNPVPRAQFFLLGIGSAVA